VSPASSYKNARNSSRGGVRRPTTPINGLASRRANDRPTDRSTARLHSSFSLVPANNRRPRQFREKIKFRPVRLSSGVGCRRRRSRTRRIYYLSTAAQESEHSSVRCFIVSLQRYVVDLCYHFWNSVHLTQLVENNRLIDWRI